MTPSVVVAAPGTFAGATARIIAERVDHFIVTTGGCSLALCGGQTPIAVYHELAAASVRWESVTIYFGDERAVPPEDPASNFQVAQRVLLHRVGIPSPRVHRMEAERSDRDSAAREYEALLPERLDVLLLGIGPDGHTASLFPGSPALRESGRRVVAVASPPPPLAPQVGRMTITPVVIDAARQVIVMVAGGDKAAVVARILEGPDQPLALPAQLARRGIWALDSAAAAQLQGRGS